MTAPKFRSPDQFVECEQRTAHRQFLLRPGKDSRELAGYMYGKALLDTDQQACVVSCLSTHYHSAHLDKSGRRSAFMQQFHSNFARKRNLQLGRRENLWATADPGDMVLLDMEAIVRKVIYVCMQPVAAGCVEHADEWTGFQILPRHWGKPIRFARPALCSEDMPEYVEFVPMPPPGFEHLPLNEVIAFFENLITMEEKLLAKKRRVPVLGVDYCEAISPFHTPKTRAPMRGLNPRFSCKNKGQLIRALRRQRELRREHREALNSLRDGNRAVEFPPGTLQMAQLAGVRCAPYCEDDPCVTRREWTSRLKTAWDNWISAPRRRV